MTDISRLGLNVTNISSNPKESKGSEKEETAKQEAQQPVVEGRQVAANDVLNFMAQTGAINQVVMAASKQNQPTTVEEAIGEALNSFAPAVVAGLTDTMATINRINGLVAKDNAAHPDTPGRMAVAMQAFEEEFGAIPAFQV